MLAFSEDLTLSYPWRSHVLVLLTSLVPIVVDLDYFVASSLVRCCGSTDRLLYEEVYRACKGRKLD